MKIKVVCHSNKLDHEGFLQFKKSMDHFNYDYIALNDPDYNWSTTFDIYLKYIKSVASEYTHILTCDSWDTIAYAPMQEIMDKYKETDCGFWSVEKACFPNPSLADDYPKIPFQWKYINCGGSLFPIPLFIETFEKYKADSNIQEWAAKNFLYDNDGRIKLDTNCDIFQTMGFEHEGDFSFEDGRIVNNFTESKPVLAHFNGRTEHAKYTDSWNKSFA